MPRLTRNSLQTAASSEFEGSPNVSKMPASTQPLLQTPSSTQKETHRTGNSGLRPYSFTPTPVKHETHSTLRPQKSALKSPIRIICTPFSATRSPARLQHPQVSPLYSRVRHVSTVMGSPSASIENSSLSQSSSLTTIHDYIEQTETDVLEAAHLLMDIYQVEVANLSAKAEQQRVQRPNHTSSVCPTPMLAINRQDGSCHSMKPDQDCLELRGRCVISSNWLERPGIRRPIDNTLSGYDPSSVYEDESSDIEMDVDGVEEYENDDDSTEPESSTDQIDIDSLDNLDSSSVIQSCLASCPQDEEDDADRDQREECIQDEQNKALNSCNPSFNSSSVTINRSETFTFQDRDSIPSRTSLSFPSRPTTSPVPRTPSRTTRTLPSSHEVILTPNCTMYGIPDEDLRSSTGKEAQWLREARETQAHRRTSSLDSFFEKARRQWHKMQEEGEDENREESGSEWEQAVFEDEVAEPEAEVHANQRNKESNILEPYDCNTRNYSADGSSPQSLIGRGQDCASTGSDDLEDGEIREDEYDVERRSGNETERSVPGVAYWQQMEQMRRSLGMNRYRYRDWAWR